MRQKMACKSLPILNLRRFHNPEADTHVMGFGQCVHKLIHVLSFICINYPPEIKQHVNRHYINILFTKCAFCT